jgi:hypothetical protein
MSHTLSPARVIARFAVRVVLLVVFAAFGSVGFGRSLAVLLWMSIILCALAGLVRREPLVQPYPQPLGRSCRLRRIVRAGPHRQ